MGRRELFDEVALASAGLDVVRLRGWPAVSVRAVAARLGVSPMALYRLAPDADHLRHLVADHAAAPIQPPGTENDDLRSILRSWAFDAYRHLDAYPGLASYVIANWTELPAWLDIVEALLATAHDEGMAPSESVAVVNAVFAYVLARSQLRDGIRRAPPRRLQPIDDQRDRYPRIRASRAEFTTAKTEKHFHVGLAALLDGLGDGGA